MTVLERAPEPKVSSQSQSTAHAGLVVGRTDITFEDLTSDTVLIRVKIRNEGEHRSSPTVVRLESAPFGAFVAWRPLAVLPVPSLQPGESRELSVEAMRPRPTPLGDFNRVPPTSVLTALNASPEERPLQPGSRLASTLLNLIRKQGISRRGKNTTVTGLMLPPDLWALFGREQPHWAGNINVFVGQRAVERHMANALRIYSGRTNLAMFVVGGMPGKCEAYAFDLVGVPPDWTAALHNMSSAKTLVVGSSNKPVREREWVDAALGTMMVMLAVRPPMICEEGKIQVHVTRRSCGETAIVEFDLDPTAQGAGCYVA
jgi:hypothetical protein